jgi:protein ImuB
MLWLALHPPWLSLEAFCATLPVPAAATSPSAPPVALIAAHRIAAVNATAAAAGVRVGQKRATALALAPPLVLAEADAARDTAALTAIAHAALAFTPTVVLDGSEGDRAAGAPPRPVLLEVASCLRLFGGLPALLASLRAALAPLAHRIEVAAAPTAAGAALLARWRAIAPAPPAAAGDAAADADADADAAWVFAPHLFASGAAQRAALGRRLDEAPVWLLGPGREHWEALQGMGLSTIADLRALPRTGLARRFGEGLLAELDAARGDRPDPRRAVEPPAVFDSRVELYTRADTTAQVLHGAAVLLARLVAWARARQVRIVAFELVMRHEAGRGAPADPTVLEVGLAEPALDEAHLRVLLAERLAQAALPAPTLELHLRCHRFVRSPPPSGELFPTRRSGQEGVGRLLERLRARLGEQQVLQPRAAADHRPERASRLAPPAAAPAPAEVRPQVMPEGAVPPGPEGAIGTGQRRPAWLLEAPRPIAVDAEGRPRWQGRRLELLRGPERIEAGWWDGGLAARDYYVALTPEGALVWVFRERLTAGRSAAWFLHGLFG